MAIADKLTELNNAKQAIKTAIADKGVSMDNVPFTEYAGKIADIQAGGGGSSGSENITVLAKLMSDNLEVLTEEDLKGATIILPYAFSYHRNLKEVHFPESVTTIQGCTFRTNNMIEVVTMRDKVTTLGSTSYDYVFYQCAKLTTIEISAGVEQIYGSCFRNCTALKKVVFRGNVKAFNSYNIFAEDQVLEEIDLRYCTAPPTLAATSSFDNVAKKVSGGKVKIYIKKGLTSKFKEEGTNWAALTNVEFVEVEDD